MFEELLDAQCLVLTRSADEYTTYVNSLTHFGIKYDATPQACSELYLKLREIVTNLDYRRDPQCKHLLEIDEEWSRQKLVKWDRVRSSSSTKDINAFARNAEDLLINLGIWAADTFVKTCADEWHMDATSVPLPTPSQRFVENVLFPLRSIHQCKYEHTKVSSKANALIDFLAAEYHDQIAVVLFVERRSTAFALCQLLKTAPELYRYQTSIFVGHSSTDTSSLMNLGDIKQQRRQFTEFWEGIRNICVATSVAEQDIDIQAVNIVIRFDDPQNLKSLIQSRGRARRKDSKFIYLHSSNQVVEKYQKLLELEKKMAKELEEDREAIESSNNLNSLEDFEYQVESTGAKLFYSNAPTHLQHFCSVVAKTNPVYVLSGEHGVSLTTKVILPSCVPVPLQQFHSEQSWFGEKAARCDAAFQAYKALHEAGLVTENLVTFQPEPPKNTQTRNEI